MTIDYSKSKEGVFLDVVERLSKTSGRGRFLPSSGEFGEQSRSSGFTWLVSLGTSIGIREDTHALSFFVEFGSNDKRNSCGTWP